VEEVLSKCCGRLVLNDDGTDLSDDEANALYERLMDEDAVP
jgi:hypothetical protein